MPIECVSYGDRGFRDGLHLDQAVVEGRATSDVGQALAGELVDVGAVQPELAPPDAEAMNHSRPGSARDLGAAVVLAALVEDTHRGAVADAARGGIGFIDLEHRFALDRAQAADVD